MTTTIQMPKRAFREIEVEKLAFSEFDVRTKIDESSLEGLASTMNGFGTLQPILVSLDSRSSKYRVIIGGRRVRAARNSGKETIPAFIVDDLKDNDALVMMLIENMQREDLEPLEESRGMAELRDRFGYNDSQIAHTIGKREQFVRERLALLRLPARVVKKLEQGRISVSQAVPLTRLEGMDKTQIAIADDAEERELTVAVVDRMVQEAETPKRRYKKMTRKHKLKKSGQPLTKEHMQKKIRQAVLRGEQLLDMLESFPMQRWDPQEASKLHEAVDAIEQGIKRFKRRVAQRSREKE